LSINIARRVALGLLRFSLTCFIYFLFCYILFHSSSTQLNTQELHLRHLKQEHICSTWNLMYEARGEGLEGMQAVHQVVLNRVKSRKYPSTICGVVLQKYQFSWTADKSKVNRMFDQRMFDTSTYEASRGRLTGFSTEDSLAYQQAFIVGSRGLQRPVVDSPAGYTGDSSYGMDNDLAHVLHYARFNVQVQWMRSMTAVKRIKNHVFYR